MGRIRCLHNVGVSALLWPRSSGASAAGQALAALFCATLPSAILAASGAKNDLVVAAWLVAMAYFAFRYVETSRLADACFCGAALGLALLTKATAYLFAPFVLAAILIPARRREARAELKTGLRGLAIIALIAVIPNIPQYIRNYNLSGSLLGFDSAQGDGFFRWRNETFGWKQTVSNIARNASEQLGGRSDQRNQEIYDAVAALHRTLGIDLNDPATTWRWSIFTAPKNANHGRDSPNRTHLALLGIDVSSSRLSGGPLPVMAAFPCFMRSRCSADFSRSALT